MGDYNDTSSMTIWLVPNQAYLFLERIDIFGMLIDVFFDGPVLNSSEVLDHTANDISCFGEDPRP